MKRENGGEAMQKKRKFNKIKDMVIDAYRPTDYAVQGMKKDIRCISVKLENSGEWGRGALRWERKKNTKNQN